MGLEMSEKVIQVVTGIPESEQLSSFKNATLHQAGDGIACSIAITPDYPANLKSQGDIAAHLKSSFQHLADLGWQIEIQTICKVKLLASLPNSIFFTPSTSVDPKH